MDWMKYATKETYLKIIEYDTMVECDSSGPRVSFCDFAYGTPRKEKKMRLAEKMDTNAKQSRPINLEYKVI